MDRELAVGILERLHQAQNAFYAGDDERPLRALLHPDISWHIPGRNAIAGTYRGVDEVLAYMTLRRGLANATLRLHPGELLVGDGDHIGALTDGTALVGGSEHRWSTLGLYRLRDGLIVECRLLPFDAAAFDRIWQPE